MVSGLIIGLLTTWQFRSEIAVSTDYPSDELKARDDLVNSLLNDQVTLQNRILSLRTQIDENQSNIQESSQVANIDTLNKLKADVGLTPVGGEGIEVVLDDSKVSVREGANVSSSQLIQASDIRDIVNVLFSSNADAVSVNQQRIIATSAISSVNASILVNDAHIAPPFVIRAVGDRDYMVQRLRESNLLSGIYDRMLREKIIFEIKPQKELMIPIYSGDLQADYLKLDERK